jgi:hypothetical protein
MRIVKQSSTARDLCFLMVDSTDHVSGKTGLTPTVTLSKNGGSFASPAGSVSEVANGWYKVAGNATDSNTLGGLVLHATGTGADPCDVEFEVVAFDPQNAVRLGLTALPAAAANAANGLLVSTAGGLDVDAVASNVAFIKQYAFQGPFTIDTTNGTTSIVLDSGPPTDIDNVLVIISDASNSGALSYAEGAYVQSTLTITLTAAAPITVDPADTIVLMPLAGNNVNVTSMDDDVISAGAVSAAAASKIAVAVDLAAINAGDGADLLTAIANQIAADWVAGDASPLAVVAALTANATFIQLVADASDAATALGTAGNGLSNIPWNASWDAQVESEVTDALTTYDGPTNAEMVARTLVAADYATASNLAATDTVVDATKVIADKLDTMMELDGSVYRLTTNSVEQVAAGSGTADWTADEKTAIRSILGIPGSGTTPADPSSGILDTIRDQTTSAVLEAAARAGVMGTWTDEVGGSFVLTITG